MDTASTEVSQNGQALVAGQEDPSQPRSLTIAKGEIKTGRQYANFMSALMTDLIEGKISPGIGNAACNAGGKLLKVVEMQMKYGSVGSGTGEKVLMLTGEAPAVTAAP